jgi:histidine triad (HIT) family protein
MADMVVTDSIFSKIIRREIPASIRYEDDEFIVIDDIRPAAPVHMLVIPKHPYQRLEDVDIDDEHFHARLLQVGRLSARKAGIEKNYKLFMNVGKKVQAVHHIHLHVTGGWPEDATREELDITAKKLHDDGLTTANLRQD